MRGAWEPTISVAFDAGDGDVEAVAADVRAAVRELQEADETLPDGEPDVRERRDSVGWHWSRRSASSGPSTSPERSGRRIPTGAAATWAACSCASAIGSPGSTSSRRRKLNRAM